MWNFDSCHIFFSFFTMFCLVLLLTWKKNSKQFFWIFDDYAKKERKINNHQGEIGNEQNEIKHQKNVNTIKMMMK